MSEKDIILEYLTNECQRNRRLADERAAQKSYGASAVYQQRAADIEHTIKSIEYLFAGGAE